MSRSVEPSWGGPTPGSTQECVHVVAMWNGLAVKKLRKLSPDMLLRLEALAVYNARPRFVVLLLRDPHLLEGGKGRKDGPSNPDGVLTFGRCDHLDLHRGRGQGGKLLCQTFANPFVHGGTAGQHNVAI